MSTRFGSGVGSIAIELCMLVPHSAFPENPDEENSPIMGTWQGEADRNGASADAGECIAGILGRASFPA